MERIRIVLTELPRMLRDIVSETIGRQTDMLVVSESSRLGDEPACVVPAGTDVVITGLQHEFLADRYSGFMREHPKLKVLGITGDARRAFLFELRPHRIPLGDASPDGLLEAIRTSRLDGA